VGIDPSYPPFALTTEDGKYEGFEVDVAKAVSNELKEELELVNLEYPSALVALMTGKIDLVVSVDIGDTKKDRVYLSNTLMTCGFTLVVNANNKTIKSVADIKDGIKVGVVQGTIAGEEATRQYKDNIKLMYFDSADIMYTSLEQNKIDAVINDSVVNAYYMQNARGSAKVKIISEEFAASPGVAAISRKSKLGKSVLKALETIEKNGELEKIRKKWNFHL
jgi:polar amino acid transport system substrate-binding protein